MPEVFGNTAGLAPQAHTALSRIYRRKVPLDRIATPELVRSLADASRLSKRQVGALVHRSGTVETVVVGTATALMLPDIGRLRAAQGRFRGLRLVHTHLFGESLTHDDLVDLTRLRLDLVCAVLMRPDGEPGSLTWAWNVPAPELSEGTTEPAYEIAPPTPYGAPQPHFGELIGALEEEFARRARTREVSSERAMLIHIGDKKVPHAAARGRTSLQELHRLADTAGVSVVDEVVQLRARQSSSQALGRGKLEEVVMRAIDLDAELLIFDRELSPAQAREIARATDLRVVDRSQLILDIFAQNAATRDGKLQVELAQLKYRLPHLGQTDDALSRLTGGIGGRGPGETKLEIGRRRARERITRLERELRHLGKKRTQLRRRRVEGPEPILALVGYTNAGKSTLLNALTGAGVLAQDKLFATLDPRARRLRLPSGQRAVISDTVGFIREMPEALFAAFKATFEEAAHANLLLHVIDVSSPESQAQEQTTEQLLAHLGLEAVPRLTVLNKADQVVPAEAGEAPTLSTGSEDAHLVSAHTGAGIPGLLARIEQILTPRLDPGRAALEQAWLQEQEESAE